MFTTRRFTKFAGTALVGTALSIGALAGEAAACTPDRFFLGELKAAGLGFISPADAIDQAQAVCTGLDTGESRDVVRDKVLADNDLTVDQANVFVAASAEHYCPEYV